MKLVVYLLICILGYLVGGTIGLVLVAVVGLIGLVIFVILEAVFRTKDSGGRLEKKCPSCAELVASDAQKCRHCSHEFSEELIFPSSIVGEERRKLGVKYKIKYSPLSGSFKYKGRSFGSFEEAAYAATQEDKQAG
jgi:hypothetical protein